MSNKIWDVQISVVAMEVLIFHRDNFSLVLWGLFSPAFFWVFLFFIT